MARVQNGPECRRCTKAAADLTGGAGQNRLRHFLVVAQAAGSLVVLIMAGLFLRSLERAQKMDLGFKPEHVFNFTMDVSEARI